MLQNLNVKEFIDELSSNSPAPGGGSAAALSAALASALGSMVFNLTINKKAYNEYEEDIKNNILKSLENTNSNKNEFLNLMDKDAEEFLELMSAFKLPKNSEEEKNLREIKIQDGYQKALEIPYKVANKAFELYKYIEIAAKYGNKNAISDAGVAALLIQTAVESAVLNVKINLSSIKNEEYKIEIEKQCKLIVEEGTAKKNSIIDIVNSKL
ncbi:cyclodeaminase/cyclohydrolase family protein [Clostridium sp. YIM B02515]|uniref:Cyclodeaminase/cyclohydrolase family protein n=1 Tax=Clostridium rhizosphaerae TaxID=2803861 RepID=A0ABS1TFT4_9CLOT|nr:cyclodeaminase/cyclohydrolase family protein [Clostridium rhizosphaerae]MBL4938111.1 cyclodeaminase/cyclohydrolase family protein [Clostridium rhizosphaerae]